MIVVRILVCIALFCLPFLALVALEGRPEGMLWMIFPVFGALPAVVGALLVFVPLEMYLDARGQGRLKNVAVPVAGALLIFLLSAVMWTLSGDVARNFGRLVTGGPNVLGPFLVWSVLGAFWGGLWRFTAWVGTRLVRRFRARPA